MEKENKEILFKANALIKGQVSISSNEYKIFNKILYRCQIEPDNDIQMVARLSQEELKEIVKVQNDATPKALLQTLERFMKVIIRFEKDKSYVSTNLINKVEVDKVNGEFKCSIDKDLYDVLMGYKEIGYSPIDLKLVKHIDGFYAQRLYEIFRIWSGTKEEITYTLDELKKMLLINKGTSYDLYSNFKRKIVDKAIKEINKKLNMQVTYVEKKVGRKVTALNFFIVDNVPRKYEFERTKITEPKNIEKKSDIEDDIDSIDYMNLIDLKINKSIHNIFLNDFYDYKNYISAVEKASENTLSHVGGKTINKKNYKYFKVCLENLI